ncbi:MAG: DUF11 domain-containing protein [Micrococcales bacterium]|nr:DUF11 domain-containing protein [Micrococcales bacterium]
MRRSLAAGAVVCLGLLGAAVVLPGGSSPAVAANSPVGVEGGPVHYVIGSLDELDEWLAIDTRRATTSWYQGSPSLIRAVVLAGDSVTWWEAVGMFEIGSPALWSPNAEHWAMDPHESPIGDYTRIQLDLPATAGRDCATQPPAPWAPGTDTLINAWCRGPMIYTASITDVTIDDNHMIWGVSAYDSTNALNNGHPHGALLTGPNNSFPGMAITASEHLYVLDPALELTKQVCTSTVVSACDVNDPDMWVDSVEIPSGSTQAVFRIDVTNTGNVELVNVHVAKDTVVPLPVDAGKVGTPTTNGGPVDGALFADTLQPDETATLIVTVPIDGTLVGPLRNIATANADLPDEIPDPIFGSDPTIDPNGERLSKRFTGNPTPQFPDGEPAMVPSNIDEAQVSEQDPSIALQKWVCEAGTGCAEPTGADLDTLAAGTPAGGWVKATTVEMSGDAQWLLVITNTGTTKLTDITLSVENLDAGASGHGATTSQCAQGTNLGTLAIGETVTVMCTTAEITATGEWGSGEDVVNTAQVSGDPSDVNGVKLPGPNGVGTQPPKVSDYSIAEVNTVAPAGEDPPPPPPPPGEDPPPPPPPPGEDPPPPPEPPVVEEGPPPPPPVTPPAPQLPPMLESTGANTLAAAVLGVVLLVGGTGLVLARVVRLRQRTGG